MLKACAALLGGRGGFYRNKQTNITKGMVTIAASNLKKAMISSAVLLEEMNIPGIVIPIAIETKEAKTPTKVVMGTC